MDQKQHWLSKHCDLGAKKNLVLLKGGLGNQLFQLAVGIELQKTMGYELSVSRIRYLKRNERSYQLEFLEQKLGFNSSKLFPIDVFCAQRINEGNEFAASINVHNKSRILLDGYFQNPYISPIGQEMILIALNESELNVRSRCDCKLTHLNIHIRRGDYVSKGVNLSYLGVLSDRYWIKIIRQFEKDTHIRIITESNLELEELRHKLGNSVDYIETEHLAPAEVLDFLAQTDYLAISNSSLSWWAAELLRRRNPSCVVISPADWFRGNPESKILIREEWESRASDWLDI